MGLKGARLTWRITQTAGDAVNLRIGPRFTANTTTSRNDHTGKIVPLNYKVYDSHGIITSPSGVVSTIPLGANNLTSPGWINFENSRFKMQLGTYDITLTVPLWAREGNFARFRIIDDPRLYSERNTESVDSRPGAYYNYPQWNSPEMVIYATEGYTWEGLQFNFTYKNTNDADFKILTITPSVDFQWQNRYIDGSNRQREMISLDIIKVSNT